MSKKLNRLLAEANQTYHAGLYEVAAKKFKKITTLEPRNLDAWLKLGDIHMRFEQFEEALQIYANLVESNSLNTVILSNFGAALLRCGHLGEAEKVLRYAIELDPKNVNARINLGNIFQNKNDRQGALNNALEAVAADNTSALAFNNLGCALGGLMMSAEARHAYQTAVMLDNSLIDSRINLAQIESQLGNNQQALQLYQDVLSIMTPESRLKSNMVNYYASYCYLALGNLPQGWDNYEHGFSSIVPLNARRHPARTFVMPAWDGSPLKGRRLLIWREQGIGDELLFGSCLHELLAQDGQIILECSDRLVTPFRRSFPSFLVRPDYVYSEGLTPIKVAANYTDFDVHLPIGSLPKFFRRQFQDFDRSVPFIIPPPTGVKNFQERLLPYKNTSLIGICWRSGLLAVDRNTEYTLLDDWGDIFNLQGCTFVNLQYGDCEAELLEAEARFNIKIMRWADLDLKNDLDNVFALISCLDLVVTAGTAVCPMSAAVGKPTLLIQSRWDWPNLGTRYYPWFSNIHCFTAEPGQIVATCIETVAAYLAEHFKIVPSNGQTTD